MSEHKSPIPSRIYNAAVGGHICGTEDIIDDDKNKTQKQINSEVEESLGTGGSVDSRIASAVAAETSRAQAAEENLRQLYNNLSQSQPIPVTSLPATGEAGKIYRLAGTTSYADYMYAEGALTTPIKMAEYDNAIDDEPTFGSENLVKSGGVYPLKRKTANIAKVDLPISDTDDEIKILSEEDEEIVKVNNEGIDVKGFKMKGSKVLDRIELPYTEQNLNEKVSFCDNNDTEEYAYIDELGVHAQAYYDMNGNMLNAEALPEIILPSDMYILSGRITQLFFKGFIKAVNPYNYAIKCVCDNAGMQIYERYIQFNPTTTGDRTLTISIQNNKAETIVTKTITLHIVSAPVSVSNKNVLIVGASVEEPGQMPAELYRMLNESGGTPAGLNYGNVQFVGSMNGYVSRYEGYEDVFFEAHGGWSWDTYISESIRSVRFQVSATTGIIEKGAIFVLKQNNQEYAKYLVQEVNLTGITGNIRCIGQYGGSVENLPYASTGTLYKYGDDETTITFSSWTEETFKPFIVNGQVDFTQYAEDFCNNNIDYLITMLGVNSLSASTSDFTQVMGNAKTFIDAFHRDFPSAKVLVGLVHMPEPSFPSPVLYQYACVLQEYNKRLIAWCSESGYSSFMKAVPINAIMDCENEYPTAEKAVNYRSSKMELVGTNMIHPTDIGRKQMADALLPLILI